MDIRDEIQKRRKDGWIEAWFAIEAMAVAEDVVKSALQAHAEKLEKVKDVFVYEKKFSDVKKVETPPKGVSEAFSQIVEVKLFAKDLFTLVNVVVVFGPSAIEIIGPDKKEVPIDEMQNMVNVLAGIVHQFASAGIGGMVISPK